jgi:polysaccharide deacetylase 2 family uncharacterized protein YibQ
MPKRTSRKTSLPRAALLLGVSAIALFLLGELLLFSSSDSAQIRAARYLRIGDRARVTQLVGREIRRGLDRVGVRPDSITERTVDHGAPAVRWRVGLPPGASLIQANYAITAALRERGGEVLSAREEPGDHGETTVTMQVGLPYRATHEITLVRFPVPSEPSKRSPGRIALVLYGFESDEEAEQFFALEPPFAVALMPGPDRKASLFRAARDGGHEVVLYIPLEPLNYPRVDPGPGTILVTMRPSKIVGTLRRYFDQAGHVAAVANYMGSLATQDAQVMSAVYSELKRRGLPFLHLTPVPGAVCRSLASETGVSYEEPDVVIDHEARDEGTKGLDRAWAAALESARAHGQALVLMRATGQVRKWLPEAVAPARLGGVRLVPPTDVMRRPLAL